MLVQKSSLRIQILLFPLEQHQDTLGNESSIKKTKRK